MKTFSTFGTNVVLTIYTLGIILGLLMCLINLRRGDYTSLGFTIILIIANVCNIVYCRDQKHPYRLTAGTIGYGIWGIHALVEDITK